MSKSLPGLPQPSTAKLQQADLIVAHTFALATALGVPEREIAAAALKLAISTADKQGDPDGWLSILLNDAKGAK